MYLRTLEICILKYTNLILQKFLSSPGLDLLADINMLIMVEKGSRGGIVTLFIDTQKLITNTGKITIKIKNCHIFNIVM